MNHTSARNILRRAAAFVLAGVLAIPPVSAAAGEQRLQTGWELVDGLTYTNTVTENGGSRVESFALELKPDRTVYPILTQSSGTVYGLATINKAVSNAQAQGYQVLGAVNTDYFSTATGVPMGIVVEEGIYKSSGNGRSAMTIKDGEVTFLENVQVSLTLMSEAGGGVIIPDHFNKWRTPTGGLYLLNEYFSSVSTRSEGAGWYVRMKVQEDRWEDIPELTVNSQMVLEVTEVFTAETAPVIGENEFILTADSTANKGEVFEYFQVGDEITLTTTCENRDLSRAQWAGGTGDIMIADGELTDSSNWTHIKEGKAPRTALGVKRDGTLVLYAADGRQSGYSQGLTQKALAEELLEQGCEWAVNLDGGGSTTMSVWVPGQNGPAVVNTPSDGKVRSCATYLLLVSEKGGNGRADRLVMKEDGLVAFAGSSLALPDTVVLDDRLNVLEQELTDLTVTSREGLGNVAGGVYRAGTAAGTDTLRLRSRALGAEGTARIHVVDTLTELKVTRAGESASLTKLSVKPGETVQLSVSGSYWGRTALRDCAPVNWTVSNGVGTVDKNGLFTASEKGGEGTITATVGGLNHTITLTTTNIHRDVTEGHWAYQAVEYCYANGIVGGISATEFGRDNQIRRADFMLMLYNAVGKPAVASGCIFTDVKETDYYYTALSWGQSVGLASGTGNGAYSPNANITREQAFTILRQAMPLLGKECPTGSLKVLDQFDDKNLIADYAKGHTATLVEQGVVSGKGTGIDPRGNLTRAEMAALLYKLITYTPIVPEPEQPDTPDIPAEPEIPEVPQEPVVDPDDYTLTLNLTEVTLGSAESVALTAVLSPELEGAEITWSSSNTAAAVVTAKGVVTNLFAGTGTPTVTVTARWNGLTASCTVRCDQAEQTGRVVDAEKGLNVRSGPGTDYSVIGSLSNLMQVIILGEDNGWYHIMYLSRSGQAAIGYISGDYVRLTESAPEAES